MGLSGGANFRAVDFVFFFKERVLCFIITMHFRTAHLKQMINVVHLYGWKEKRCGDKNQSKREKKTNRKAPQN